MRNFKINLAVNNVLIIVSINSSKKEKIDYSKVTECLSNEVEQRKLM